MMTVSEVATTLGLDLEVARGLIRFLREIGAVEHRGLRKDKGGGRGADVFDFPEDVDKRAALVIRRLRGR